jgi:hypothetical protein
MPTRRLVAAFAALALLGGLTTPAQGQATARCRAEHAALQAVGTVQPRALPHFVEVELTLVNNAPEPIRIDPERFTLVPDEGIAVSPANRADVIQALQSPTPVSVDILGFFSIGSVWVSVGLGSIDLRARAIESRLLRAAELAPGASVRGSVYYRPAAWPAQFTLLLEGLTAASGTPLPRLELRNCTMPVRPLAPPASAGPLPPPARTIPMTVRVETGPLAVSVSSVEVTRLATSLTVTVENTASTEASLFVAIGQAQLVDASGKTYAIRMLPSDLPDRVGPRGQARGRLVFEPLPQNPAVTSASLLLPGIRVGDAVHDLRVDLRF